MRTGLRLAALVLVIGLLAPGSQRASAQGVPSVIPGVDNPHPAFPWFYPPALSNQDLVLRETEVPSRLVTIPMAVAQPGSQPSTIAWQQVTLPSYRVTETTAGFIVHAHWGVRPVGDVYYWTWVPAYFRSK